MIIFGEFFPSLGIIISSPQIATATTSGCSIAIRPKSQTHFDPQGASHNHCSGHGSALNPSLAAAEEEEEEEEEEEWMD
jgi:hypothetical protein